MNFDEEFDRYFGEALQDDPPDAQPAGDRSIDTTAPGEPAERPRSIYTPRRRRGRIALTDTAGNSLARVAHTAIQRVLDNPVDICGGSAKSYALVYCEACQLGIVRDGAQIRSAKFWVCGPDGDSGAPYLGAEGRDQAIQAFLKLIQKRPKEKPHALGTGDPQTAQGGFDRDRAVQPPAAQPQQLQPPPG